MESLIKQIISKKETVQQLFHNYNIPYATTEEFSLGVWKKTHFNNSLPDEMLTRIANEILLHDLVGFVEATEGTAKELVRRLQGFVPGFVITHLGTTMLAHRCTKFTLQ